MNRILVIDDEEKMLKLYTTVLTKAGYAVVTAQGAKKGLELAASAHPI